MDDVFTNGTYEVLIHPTNTSIETILLNIQRTRFYVNIYGNRYKIYYTAGYEVLGEFGEYIRYRLPNGHRVRIFASELRRRRA